ncbi:hypothetical protein M413DRAFT_70942 [Hebeloma cylindrosporum]|uniref:Wax synthase domain-containing protein n=1 Tax=Hebeloma cylindrosporum TaxID=76867 RepID=A0A0C2YMC5_HEBCY|nr:hypothetical protein M413DRAFT_70942 [Hebeloma cylindrosporum h7]
MRGKHDLDPNLFTLCHLILLLALVLRPNARYNWLFFIPIFVLCIYSAFFCASDSGTSDFVYIMGLIMLVPTASDYILLRNHQPEFRKIGQTKATSEMTLTERLVWGASLIATARGIGWAHEPTAQIPPRPTASRRKFIASQVLWIIFYSILLDIALFQLQQNPCFRTGGPSITAFGWGWRTRVWFHIVAVYCTMSGLYATASIAGVATGLYEPGDWPHLFGSPCDAYTLRKCWGRVWHQMLRKSLTSHANFLANDVLRLPKGTFTTYFKLFTTFFLSGLIHATGDYILFQNFSDGTSIQFFFLQAAGITLEDALIALASRLGYKESSAFKMIGFAWVFAWFTFSLPIWLDPQAHAGTIDDGAKVGLIRLLKSFYESHDFFKTAA